MHFIPTLIIGGGIAGASLACALAERDAGAGVTIVDIDLFGRSGSSAGSTGGVHVLSPHPLDVRLSIASVQFFRRIAAKIDFRHVGSLRLCDPGTFETLRTMLPTARLRGVAVEEFTPLQAKDRIPLLRDVKDLGAALFIPLEGHLSLHKLRMHYLNHAQNDEVTLMDHWQVTGIEGAGPRFRVTLRAVGPRSVRKALTDGIDQGEELIVEAGRIINAAGPWAARVATRYGHALPVVPVPRQMFLVRQAGVNLDGQPLIVDDLNAISFRASEFDRKPCVLVDAPSGAAAGRIDFTIGPYTAQFEPRVVNRFPVLAGSEAVRAWVAHDESSPDGRAIVGAVPGLPGMFNFTGISAQTLSQCHMLAEGMAELLVKGDWPQDLDLEELNESRFAYSAKSDVTTRPT
jgi:sarcosine oxidase subunit beta